MQLSILTGLLAFNLTLPLSAYHQGSFFVIDLRKDASEEGLAGRKAIESSVFKAEDSQPQGKIASAKAPKTSEFESGIRSFLGGENDAATSGVEILKLENETISTESSFGEDPPAPSGFFFTY